MVYQPNENNLDDNNPPDDEDDTPRGDIATQFKPGNEFWKARTSVGRELLFKNPDDLLKACTEYFQWAHDNPLYEEKVFCHQGFITRTNISKMRAMTLSGLWGFLQICHQTWTNYKSKPEFLAVIEMVEKVIYTQKFEGASAGFLNANIIARDLGLKDHRHQDLDTTGTLGELLKRELNSKGFEEDTEEDDF